MNEKQNLIAAICLSLAILIGWQYFFEAPRIEAERKRLEQQQAQQAQQPQQGGDTTPSPSAVPVPGAVKIPGTGDAPMQRTDALSQGPRIAIETPRLQGSITLTGGIIDDLTLTDYNVELNDETEKIHLLSPAKSPQPYHIAFGWTATETDLQLPNDKTVWQADQQTLTPQTPVTLRWQNEQGLSFTRTISVDDNYLFTVSQRVRNDGTQSASLYPFNLISRTDTPETSGFYILHEGPIGVFEEKLEEIDYDDLQEGPEQVFNSAGGWIGITDKYWLTAIVPPQAEAVTSTFRHNLSNARDKYQVDILGGARDLPPGSEIEFASKIFAGAKEVHLLDRYGEEAQIPLFDRAVDFGWFYFLTKPLFYVIDYFSKTLGNFGLAILALTVCVKLVFFPLANKSYRAMAKMKDLQPEMVRLREKYGDDRQKMTEAMRKLYADKKVNPAAGCLPILVQIPVFFALYKVLFVAIEMRHAPFYGWIHDLSAQDPTNLFTLFGLIPWDPPYFLALGIWPILMGISMYGQQLLNPQPADPMQAKIFLLMPIFFTFILATFPAGLVIYWTWNNVLSVLQQYLIMKRMGVPIGGGKAKPKSA